MDNTISIKKCPSCGNKGKDNYCSYCGHPFDVKRITFRGLIYDVIHLFTKFEKGFGYTLKQLLISPGTMQRTYILGDRKKHQSPFSMFFICATVSAFLRYLILNYILIHFQTMNPAEVILNKDYLVFLYIFLVPLYAFISYLLFYKSQYNYTEQMVMILYTLSIIFLASPFLFLLLFIWPHLDVMYVEFTIYAVYFTITFINFFISYKRWKVILFSILTLALAFVINQAAEDLVIKMLYD